MILYTYFWEREKEKSTLTTFNYQAIAMFLNLHFVQCKLLLKLQRFLFMQKNGKVTHDFIHTYIYSKNEKRQKKKSNKFRKIKETKIQGNIIFYFCFFIFAFS
jgi:hypothetical protein